MYPSPTTIFHITSILNFESILSNDGLHSYRLMNQGNLGYINIAYNDIQQRRAITMVPLDPFGNLHDYVPFYFAPRSPMLYTINQGNVEGIKNQKTVIYLVSTVQIIKRNNIPFVFTDGHAIMSFSEFFNEITDLSNIDWDVMSGRMWHDTTEFPDRKRRRQAEFLVFEKFPLYCIAEIAVISNEMKMHIESLLRIHGVSIPVNIKRDWYY